MPCQPAQTLRWLKMATLCQLCIRPNPLAKRDFPWNHSNVHHPTDQPSGNTAGRWAGLAPLPMPRYAPPRRHVGRAGDTRGVPES